MTTQALLGGSNDMKIWLTSQDTRTEASSGRFKRWPRTPPADTSPASTGARTHEPFLPVHESESFGVLQACKVVRGKVSSLRVRWACGHLGRIHEDFPPTVACIRVRLPSRSARQLHHPGPHPLPR